MNDNRRIKDLLNEQLELLAEKARTATDTEELCKLIGMSCQVAVMICSTHDEHQRELFAQEQ